jgi:hypothetical protein
MTRKILLQLEIHKEVKVINQLMLLLKKRMNSVFNVKQSLSKLKEKHLLG